MFTINIALFFCYLNLIKSFSELYCFHLLHDSWIFISLITGEMYKKRIWINEAELNLHLINWNLGKLCFH